MEKLTIPELAERICTALGYSLMESNGKYWLETDDLGEYVDRYRAMVSKYDVPLGAYYSRISPDSIEDAMSLVESTNAEIHLKNSITTGFWSVWIAGDNIRNSWSDENPALAICHAWLVWRESQDKQR